MSLPPFHWWRTVLFLIPVLAVGTSLGDLATNGFSEALMQDVRYDDVRVSYVAPGSVATEFNDREASAGADWKLHAEDIARVVLDLLRLDARALASYVELRPSRPKK